MAVKTIWDRIALLQEGRSLAVFCKDVGLKNYQALKKSSQRATSPDTSSLATIARHFRLDLQWLIHGKKSSNRLNSVVVKNIRQLRTKRGWSLDDLAGKLSLSQVVLELYEKGAIPFPLDLLNDLAKKLEVAPHQMLLEDELQTVQVPELKVFQAASTERTAKFQEEDYVSIPLTASAIAAGQPIIQENKIEDYVLLHVRAVGKRNNLVASRVDGDSMEPMLHSGDIVVIDRDDKRILKNRIYAIFYEDGLTAKYVERKKELLILRPLNPNSQVQVINLRDYPDPVVGRIIGAWKEL